MADSGIGSPQDSKATNTTGSWSLIALVKYLIDQSGGGGGGGAATIADGADVTQGAIADAAVVSGATGTESAKLRSISRDIGALTETAPASDTASSGLNGRLQRIAQNITTLIASALTVVGNVASAATDSGNPVKVGGKYNSTKPTLTNGQRGDLQIEINGATAVSLYGKATNAGDIPMLASPAGLQRVAIMGTSGLGDTAIATSSVNASDNNANPGVAVTLFNGTNWDRQRAMFASTVLASAARTATISTDVTNYNGKTFQVILNITAAPNTAATLTPSIRVKDSISGNYVTLLTGAAIVGSVITGAVPNTTRYVVAQGIVAVANVSAIDVLARTMNVNMVHSNSDSWTYSVSVDIGV